jgi:hypothetical protein
MPVFLNIMYQVNKDRPFPQFVHTTFLDDLVDAKQNDYSKNSNFTDVNILAVD